MILSDGPSGGDPDGSAKVREILSLAEHRAELLLALLHGAAFLVLALGLRVFDLAEHSHVLKFSLVVYGGSTVMAAAVAWWRYYRPWTAWILATLDVAILLHFVAFKVFHAGETAAAALSFPVTTVMLLFLSFAAVRYRPAVVLYSGGLFVAGVAAIQLADTGLLLPNWSASREGVANLAIIGLAAVALWTTSTRARVLLLELLGETQRRLRLSRYVPDPALAQLDIRPGTSSTRVAEVAVLFVDMRGFTSLSERLEPMRLLRLLGAYRRLVVDAVVAQGGMVDKFIGDAVMVVFGATGTDRSAGSSCVKAGIDVLERLAAFNVERRRHGEEAIEVGIGAHYGQAIIGTIGGGERVEYSVIGDAVNTAQRVERLAAETGSPFLISRELLVAAGAAWADRFREAGRHRLRGRQRDTEIFEFVSALPTQGAIADQQNGRSTAPKAVARAAAGASFPARGLHAVAQPNGGEGG